MIGKLLSLPFKIANVPFKAMEDMMTTDHPKDEPARLFSIPLDAIADALEKIDE